MAKTVEIPDLSLVVLIGASGAGKSTFAERHFLPTEIISSDRMRAWVDDDESSMAATPDAFAAVHFLASIRLKRGRLTVIDATNVRPEDRAPLVAIAREYHALPVAIVFDLPVRLCEQRNELHADRTLGRHVVRNHSIALRRSFKKLRQEGFRHIVRFDSVQQIDEALVVRTPLYSRQFIHDRGPFDIIGDIHGCADELMDLLDRLGYVAAGDCLFSHPENRKVVFLGDLVDRGPKNVEVLRIAMAMVAAGKAYCVPGNHDVRLLRKLRGSHVQVTHGLAETLSQVDALPADEKEHFIAEATRFIDSLISHYVLDEGRLVVVHAGMKESMQGRGSGKVRDFAIYGESTGETDEFGLPIRVNWAEQYRGRASVVYGHVAVPRAEWLNNTIDIDTGCVFGGRLTALRWPERELVQVEARAQYMVPARPLSVDHAKPSLQSATDDLLVIDDVIGKRGIQTRLAGTVMIRAEHSAAALETISRFAVDPHWLIFLPPTISPCDTTSQDDMLEHPREAFAYYRSQGVPLVICEEKHMGSRGIVILCQSAEVARHRFGVTDGSFGECFTRTGRRFFTDPFLHDAFLQRLRISMEAAGLWDALKTDWVCLDGEIMPWNLKARELLVEQYAPVAVAGKVALQEVAEVLLAAEARGLDLGTMRKDSMYLAENIGRYRDAYAQYCWQAGGLDAIRFAPFHLLASEGAVHVDKSHAWHMETLSKLALSAPDFVAETPYQVVDLFDNEASAACIQWWEQRTQTGSEGIVVKPLEHVARGQRGMAQPAMKCRGSEYLRIIYGPDYTNPKHLERLRKRSTSHKRSLAIREFALGIEALERFARREPLRRVHECVFGILALESEPVDPRL